MTWRAARSRAATLVLVAVVATACTGAPPPPGGDDGQPPRPAATSTATPSGTATPGPAGRDPGVVRIAVAGDVHFEGALSARLADPATALAPVAPWFTEADLAIVNLETSVGTGGSPEPGKRFTFSAPPSALRALATAGIDVVTMANNHALDFGRDRLTTTLRAARRARRAEPPLDVIGVGRHVDEAFRPSTRDVRGTVVTTRAASVSDQDPTADRTGDWAATEQRSGVAMALDPARLLAAVRRARTQADVVLVYLHWGVQGDRCPSDDQRHLARRVVGAGADVVVGSHAHRLQGDGLLGEGYVAYGLGNFAWYTSTGDAGRTGVLTLAVRPGAGSDGRARVVRARWRPARIGSDGLPHEVSGDAAAAFARTRDDLRRCAGLSR